MESLGLALEDASCRLTNVEADLVRAVADRDEQIEQEKEVRKELRKVQVELDHIQKFGQDYGCR